MEFLIEQNMSRVLYNIGLGEKQLLTTDKMITLDQALDQALGQASQSRPAKAAPAPSPSGSTPENGVIR